MKDNVITFEEAMSMNKIKVDGLAKDFSKQSFWHYTKEQSLPKIFSTEEVGYTLLCNRIDKTNDLIEREKVNANNVFVTCFCNTDSEKIPMWYLYGSLTGNGVSIGLTPLQMLNFLKSIDHVYATRKESDAQELVSLETLEIKFGWVYYEKHEYDKTKFFYKQRFYEIKDFSDECKNCYFIKDYPWNYEKEFRIVIIDKENRGFEKLFLPIPKSLAKQMKLKVGQKFSTQKCELPMSANKIKQSELRIDMNLLERHKDEVLDYIESEINGNGKQKT